jgi:hypothetical protein
MNLALKQGQFHKQKGHVDPNACFVPDMCAVMILSRCRYAWGLPFNAPCIARQLHLDW